MVNPISGHSPHDQNDTPGREDAQEAERFADLLVRMRDGDSSAREELFALVFTELHDLAQHRMRGERDDHTLQPTALVSEAFLRICRSDRVTWNDKHHLLRVASSAMRCVLVDHARRRRASKRPDPSDRLDIDPTLLAEIDRRTIDLIALDEALADLRRQDETLAELVDLRFFGGRSFSECAEILGISPRAATRWWETARRVLLRSMDASSTRDES